MKKGWMILIGVVLVLFLIGRMFVGTRNSFVVKDEAVKTAWSQVENVYQRRADLIPNLVQTVKGVASFEQETFTAVAEARSKVNNINMAGVLDNPQKFQQFQASQGELSSALSRLMVVVERYPELKANQNFLNLQAQLEGTENRIAVERRRFNETSQAYNTAIRLFPGSIIAGMSGFAQRAYFEAAAGAEQAPEVSF
ncbi:MAG: LemA family protein [Candidatus Marinimicrobia bacterium]|nr:LemA family protein [Candidatus Neomarinimicrobiota bacterium]MCH7858240.1 LemA family protein [Candidatus Neomarinimicrobiota bacterium]